MDARGHAFVGVGGERGAWKKRGIRGAAVGKQYSVRYLARFVGLKDQIFAMHELEKRWCDTGKCYQVWPPRREGGNTGMTLSSRYPFHENALVALWHLHTVTSHRPATDLKRPFTKGYVPIHRWLPPPSVATSRLNARPLWPFRQKHVPKAMVHVLQLLRIERPMAYLWELFQGKVGLAERVCSNLSFHLSVDRHASVHLSVDCHNMPHLLRTAYHS